MCKGNKGRSKRSWGDVTAEDQTGKKMGWMEVMKLAPNKREWTKFVYQ